MSKIQQELISSKEAAGLLGAGSITQFLRDMRKANVNPALKAEGLRGAFFWDRADIDALLTASTPTADAAPSDAEKAS